MSTKIYEQFANSGTILDKKDDKSPIRKQKSAVTLQRERLEFAYEKKSNTCPACHTVRSRSGACEC